MFRRLVKAGAGKDERIAARAIFIPKHARPILEHTNGSALYTYEETLPHDPKPRLYALAFWGSSARPLYHYRYSTEDRRNQFILEFKASVESNIERKAKTSAEKAAWKNPLKVGDILHTCWGYDQTNVEFFAVTKVSGRRVWVREIAADSEATGFMSGNCWPAVPIRFIGKELMRLAQPLGVGVRVKITESSDAWPVDARSYGFSSYA